MSDQSDMAIFADDMARDSRLAKDADLLRGEVHRLRAGLAEARQTLTEREASYQADVARLTAERDRLAQDYVRVMTERDRLREERAKDQAEMIEATEVVNAAAAQIPTLRAERDAALASLAAERQQNKRLRIEVLRIARARLAEAVAYREKWCDGPNASDWDKGFAAGLESAAHAVANSIDRPDALDAGAAATDGGNEAGNDQ